MCCSLGRSWWAREACRQSVMHIAFKLFVPYLESSTQTEDTVVGFLRGKTLESKEDSLGLFGDQIICPAQQNILAAFLISSAHIAEVN